MARSAPRSSDEVYLRALELRALGHDWPAIARALGVARSTLANTVSRIRADDIRLSGEPRDRVAAAYRKGADL